MHVIMARGFPWNVKPADVCTFFQNIRIVGGINGIQIRRNVAMEAEFSVLSIEDVRKALARDKDRIDSRTIHGLYKILLWSVK